MHGVGTFEAPNGARYQGGWALNVKHGLGKQSFSIGDIYEGIWKNGVPDGPGRYKVRRGLPRFEYAEAAERSVNLNLHCFLPPNHPSTSCYQSICGLNHPHDPVVCGLRVRRRVAGGQVPWPGALHLAVRREIRRGMEGGTGPGGFGAWESRRARPDIIPRQAPPYGRGLYMLL